MDYVLTIVLGLAIILMVFWLISPVVFRKKHWYRIERADGNVFVLYRTGKELWRTDILRFKDEAGHEYTFHWHWVMVLEEIDKSEVGVVREEIQRMKEVLAEKEL